MNASSPHHRLRLSGGIARRHITAMIAAVCACTTLLSTGASAQTGGSGCLDRVRAIYRTLSTPPEGSPWCHIAYTIRTEGAPGSSLGTIETAIDLVLGRKRMHLVTREIELYRDSNYTIAVVPAVRTIQLTGVGMNSMADRAMSSLLHLQDSLFGSISESDCRDVEGDRGRRELRVEAVPGDALREATGMERITFTIDPAGTTLYCIDVAYGGSSKVRRFTVTFSVMDMNYSNEALSLPVRSMFFDASGSLLAKYQGYTVKDTRTIGGSKIGTERALPSKETSEAR